MQRHERLETQRLARIRIARPTSEGARPSTTSFVAPVPSTTPAEPPATASAWPPRRPTGDPRPPLRNSNGETKCYNCFQYGHLSRDSPQPRRELKCLKGEMTGHTQRHCPVQPGAVPSTRPAAVSCSCCHRCARFRSGGAIRRRRKRALGAHLHQGRQGRRAPDDRFCRHG